MSMKDEMHFDDLIIERQKYKQLSDSLIKERDNLQLKNEELKKKLKKARKKVKKWKRKYFELYNDAMVLKNTVDAFNIFYNPKSSSLERIEAGFGIEPIPEGFGLKTVSDGLDLFKKK